MAVAKTDIGGRLRQLLAVLAWLAPRGGAPTSEVAERFGLSDGQVVELLELAACCGLPPYTPDQLMEVIVSDGWVSADVGRHLGRPRRLTPAEGFTLAASARAILAVPGADPDGALARALGKLESVLGTNLAVELDEPALLAGVRRAVERQEALEIEYYSESRDELTRRRVDPWATFAQGGHWYLDGWCHLAQAQRRFRVDRVRSAWPPGDTGPGRHEPEPGGGEASAAGTGVPEAFVPGPETRSITLVVAPRGRWVVESYPTEMVEELGDGHVRVVLAVGGLAWLERMLLRLGGDARVEGPAELADAGRQAAARLLARYR